MHNHNCERKHLWEILVPYAYNNGKPIPVKEHQKWDAQVRAITGGLTIMTTVKGDWTDPTGVIQKERMIPVRTTATKKEIREIACLTASFYSQKAVLYYRLSKKVYIDYFNESTT